MSFYNSSLPNEKSGLYPAVTFAPASYAASQTGLPGVTPQRFPTVSQQYAMPSATPSLYTPNNNYTVMSPAYASSPATGAFHSIGYSPLASIPSTTPGYPPSQYATHSYPATQLAGSSPGYAGLPLSSQLYPGSGYGTLQSVPARAYAMSPMAAYQTQLGSNLTYPNGSSFGPPY